MPRRTRLVFSSRQVNASRIYVDEPVRTYESPQNLDLFVPLDKVEAVHVLSAAEQLKSPDQPPAAHKR